MATEAVKLRIEELESSATPQHAKAPGYSSLLNQIVTESPSDQLSANLATFVDAILGEGLGIVAARPLLGAYVDALRRLGDLEVQISASKHSLQALEPRVVSFEDQDALIRQILSDAYQKQEDYTEAAKVLQGIQLESSQRKISDEDKVRTWITICRLYLEDDDTTSAESYLNRAKSLLYKIDDKELNLIFLLSQARILDSRRKFLEASQAYHNVSLSGALDEGERNKVLSKAIICAVLAPAGPQRSRVLGKLFKDERAVTLEEYGILEKMFLDRLISAVEVEKFASKLDPHQLARMSDGSTVLSKAVIEHNLLGASKLYANLGIADLGTLLNLGSDKAEEYAAHMLEQGRLSGSIDQIDGVIFFDSQHIASGRGQSDNISGARLVQIWDKHVQGLVEDAERVSSLLQSGALVSWTLA